MSKYKSILSLAFIMLVLFSMGNSVDPVVAEDHQDSASMPSGTTIRVSVASDGTQANGSSYSPSISADGRFVAFESCADNLVSDDTNYECDIFLHDILTGKTTLVSIASDGTQANDRSSDPVISGDGHFIAFRSFANNLIVSGDTNDCGDVFLHNTLLGETTRISVGSDGIQGYGSSDEPAISADGRFVTFTSYADNLIDGDTQSCYDVNCPDVFLHDTLTKETTLVSKSTEGTQGNRGSSSPAISGDGRYVIFNSGATNLIHGDTNEEFDVFLHDTLSGETTLISMRYDAAQANFGSFEPSISWNNHYVAFTSRASNLANCWIYEGAIFHQDTQIVKNICASMSSDGSSGNSYSKSSSISWDGRYVTFWSSSNNLVTGDSNNSLDVFMHDSQTRKTIRVSVATDGTEGNGLSLYPSISGDGRYIAFESEASNLVNGDTNGTKDIFIRKLMQFSDAPPSHWSFDWIEALYQAGLTSGCSIDPPWYCPEDPVTRAEMAIFLLKGMGVTPPVSDGSHPFSDIAGHWAEAWIEELYDRGITGGYPDGTYRPENQVTRAEMAIFLLKGIGVSPPASDGSHPFSDIADHWSEAWIEELYDQGITGGYPDGTYRPENQVTRAEMAVFLVNAFGLPLP